MRFGCVNSIARDEIVFVVARGDAKAGGYATVYSKIEGAKCDCRTVAYVHEDARDTAVEAAVRQRQDSDGVGSPQPRLFCSTFRPVVRQALF